MKDISEQVGGGDIQDHGSLWWTLKMVLVILNSRCSLSNVIPSA